MVDKVVLARKVAAIRDAVSRVREVLPESVEAFRSDRTAREVVLMNLFVGIQESIALATHWLADAGWDVPQSQGEIFTILADRGVLDRALALRLRAAAGLRNLIAHQYGVVDAERVFVIASRDAGDLLAFCQELARQAETG